MLFVLSTIYSISYFFVTCKEKKKVSFWIFLQKSLKNLRGIGIISIDDYGVITLGYL